MHMKQNTAPKTPEYVIDAAGRSLGRIATEAATVLRGKDKPSYQPHIESMTTVRIKNVAFIKFTGKKKEQKQYHRASGYPGGITSTLLKDMHAKKPTDLLQSVVKNMLPNNRLRPRMLKRLIIE